MTQPQVLSMIVLIVGTLVLGTGIPFGFYSATKEKEKSTQFLGVAFLILAGGVAVFGLVKGWIWWAAQ